MRRMAQELKFNEEAAVERQRVESLIDQRVPI